MIRTEHAARRAIHSSLFLPGRRALSCSLGSIDRHSKIFNTGQGTFRTTASKEFSILGNPNGGQLTYAALSAAATQTDLPDIISLQATFCKVAKTDSESELVARRLTAKKSKTQECVSVSYQQGGDSRTSMAPHPSSHPFLPSFTSLAVRRSSCLLLVT